MERLKSLQSGIEMVLQVFFNIRWLIPSGPEALLTLRLPKTSVTSDIWIIIFDSDESVLFLNTGSSTLESSMVEIEQKLKKLI